MKYPQQAQNALDRLDVALARLRTLVKKGQIREAIEFMEQGPLKDRFDELQNMINISQTGNYGARGVQNTSSL